MPTYNVVVKPNTLTEEQKLRVAQAITDEHHEATGAPKFYVQVIIDEIPGRKRFVSGYPCEKQMGICGYIRSGRNDKQRADLMRNLADRVAKAAGLDSNTIWCDLVMVEPANILKYGCVFPPPGEEQAWFEGLPDNAKQIIEKIRTGKWDV